MSCDPRSLLLDSDSCFSVLLPAAAVMSYVLGPRTCRDILVHVAANQLDYYARDDFVVAPHTQRRRRQITPFNPLMFLHCRGFFFFRPGKDPG